MEEIHQNGSKHLLCCRTCCRSTVGCPVYSNAPAFPQVAPASHYVYRLVYRPVQKGLSVEFGRVGDAVKVRGMFVHPNQLGFAVAQIPGVGRVQASVSRPEQRDIFLLQVVLSEKDADREALTPILLNAVQASCRVKVDQVEFISPGELKEDAPLIVDQRSWE